MQGMHFIEVKQVKERGRIVYKVQSRGIIEGQIGQEDWTVRMLGQPPVSYVRVLRTPQLRDLCLFDSEEDLVAFGQANWPELFPKPAPPAPAADDPNQRRAGEPFTSDPPPPSLPPELKQVVEAASPLDRDDLTP